MRKRIIAICGSTRPPENAARIARELGKALVDAGFIVATGGLGGVMEEASKGAQQSKKWSGHQVLGFLPGTRHEDANPYVDVAIPTGLNRARNFVLVTAADAVLLVHGQAGTLSEAALGWQMGRPIGALTCGGVSEQLAGKKIDDRREDEVHSLADVETALNWLQSHFSHD